MNSVTLPSNSVYTIKVGGKTYSPNSSRSIDAQKSIVRHNLGQEWGYLTKEGSMSGVPFRFNADSPAELQAQCIDFYAHAVHSFSVYDITVNGKNYSARSSHNAQSACMVVIAAP